jgi:ParB-like chromosome segregation protein Spo0J
MPAPEGPQWGGYDNVEEVPVDLLRRIPGNSLRYDVSKLSEDIKQQGVQNPAIITYFQNSRTARLAEGNHRLAAAIQAGMTHLPARVVRAKLDEEGLPVRGYEPNKHGYVPGDLKPSEIMDWEEE